MYRKLSQESVMGSDHGSQIGSHLPNKKCISCSCDAPREKIVLAGWEWRGSEMENMMYFIHLGETCSETLSWYELYLWY